MSPAVDFHLIAIPFPAASAPLPLRIPAIRSVHQPRRPALSQLVDRSDGIDRRVQRAARVEVLLDGRQQVGVALLVRGAVEVGLCDEGVREGLVGGHALRRVDGQAALDELAGRQRDAAPVLERGEGVVGDEDRLHLLEVAVAVEGGVAAEEEVGDDADGPDVADPF